MVAEFIVSGSSQAAVQSKKKSNVVAFPLRQTALSEPSLQWLANYSQKRNYVDSYALPGYFLITGRKGLSLVNQHDGYFPVCCHPNLNERLLIFPPVGSATAISEYLHTLELWPSNGVQLARIPLEEQESIVSSLKKEWDVVPMQESILDWGKYPVRSLNVKAMALREGKQFKNHRRKYNYVKKRIEGVDITESWDSKKDNKFEKFIYQWAQKKHSHNGEFSLDDYVSPYLKIISMHANSSVRSVCLLFENSVGEILGTVVVEISNGIAATYMNIAIDEISHFPAYILMKTCEFLYEENLAEVLCLGGSEENGLDKFKSDLQSCSDRTDSRLSYHLKSFLVKPPLAKP
ncbi:MAG: hypothetical protein AB8B99_08240 [Phormidesmis sp.]